MTDMLVRPDLVGMAEEWLGQPLDMTGERYPDDAEVIAAEFDGEFVGAHALNKYVKQLHEGLSLPVYERRPGDYDAPRSVLVASAFVVESGVMYVHRGLIDDETRPFSEAVIDIFGRRAMDKPTDHHAIPIDASIVKAGKWRITEGI